MSSPCCSAGLLRGDRRIWLPHGRHEKLCALPQVRRRRLPMGIKTGRRRPSSTGPSRRSNDGSLPRISELMERERASKTWLSFLRRELASSNLRTNEFFIRVSHHVRLPPAHHRRVAVNVCLQLILTNEKYRHLISILLPLTSFASANRLSARVIQSLRVAMKATIRGSKTPRRRSKRACKFRRNPGRDSLIYTLSLEVNN